MSEMFAAVSRLFLGMLFCSTLVCEAYGQSALTSDNGWKNMFAVCWHNSPPEHIKYARQMGYDYIGLNNYMTVAQVDGLGNKSGLRFYMVDPQYNKEFVFKGFNDMISNRTFTQAEKDFYNGYMAWKSTEAFPNNLASGHFWSSGTFHAMWDFQQQRVVDMVVEGIIAGGKGLEDSAADFRFAGVMFDVPRLYGDFHYWKSDGSVPFTRMSNWTGSDSALLHSGITHAYPTYQDGFAAFFKKLSTRMKQEFPNAKWILEPGKIYNTEWLHADGWVEEIVLRSDKNLLVPDFLSQEHGGTQFIDDGRIFSAGLNITKDMVGSTTPLDYGRSELGQRTMAAKAAINGAWLNWFGRMGKMSAEFTDKIENVAPRLKLIRVIPNWDNLRGVSLTSRSWNGSVYQSPTSYADANVIYSRHWKTGKLFVVFNNHSGVVRLKTGEAVQAVRRVDSYFVETVDGMSDVLISGGTISLKSSVPIPIDSQSNSSAGVGYIVTISTAADTIAPASPTGLKVIQ
ncbi:MAG: hypothetical protein IT291_05570 [Deltaproteobacteria bacterium]|nr:hypothetical protein [Deltaproteobacteria bacterium]